jgi:hypothetical protein
MEPTWIITALAAVPVVAFIAARYVHTAGLRRRLRAYVPPAHYLSPWVDVRVDDRLRNCLPADIADLSSTHGRELFAKFQTSFYADPTDAAFKVLRAE